MSGSKNNRPENDGPHERARRDVAASGRPPRAGRSEACPPGGGNPPAGPKPLRRGEGPTDRAWDDAEEEESLSLMSASEVGIEIPGRDAPDARARGKARSETPPESTLADLLRGLDRLPVNEAVGIARQIAGELEATWDREVIRSDIRPGNILIAANGDVRIAKPPSGGRPQALDPVSDDLYYVSPEQLKGGTIDGRADIYALGVLLYRMVTGEFPFKGDDGEAIARARLGRPPPRANEVNPEIQDALAQIIDTMLSEDLAFRYPNPSEFLHDVRLVMEGPVPESKVGTTIMEKPGSEAKTPATGTPAILDARTGEPNEAGVVADAPRDLLEPDLWREPERLDAGEGSAGRAPGAAEGAPSSHGQLGADGDRWARWKSPAAVATVAVAGAGVLAALVAGVLLLGGGPSPDTDTSPSVAGGGAGERTDELEAEAGARCQALLKLYAAGEYKRVADEIGSFGGRYAGTSRAGELASLLRMAADKLAETRKKDEEAERKRRELAALEAAAAEFYEARRTDYEAGDYRLLAAGIEAAGDRYAATAYAGRIASLGEDARREFDFAGLLDRARGEIGRADHDAALATLGKARALKDSEEAAELTAKAQRCREVSLGRTDEEDGKLLRAIAHLRKALAIESDAELAAHVVDLERRAKLQKLVAEAKARESANNWRGALNSYRDALKCAQGDEKRSIELAIEKARSEIAYRDAMGKARAAFESRRWSEAMASARGALRALPGDEEARRIIAAAAKSLAPAKRMTNSIGMDFVLVPAGEFLMGTLGGDPDEGPVHRVRLDSYYIGAHEVTNAEFEAFDPSRRDERTVFSPADDMPAVLVTWHDAVAFCARLTEKEGVEYRLPTEAEWERAARGSDGRAYPWGGAAPGAGGRWRCNIGAGRSRAAWDLDGHGLAAPVGSYARFGSPFGAQDMCGNVWEWCLDWYRSDYYSAGEASNPRGPERGRQRVLRGASFANGPGAARSANRTAKDPDYREATIGFRCARVLSGPKGVGAASRDRPSDLAGSQAGSHVGANEGGSQ